MSIQLNYTEDFSDGLKRLMIEECNSALEYLRAANDEEGRHEAVHEARKAFKKIRGCLRLVRDEINYYDKENTWFRDRGREISEVRDATSNLEALEMLKDQYESRLYKNSFSDLYDDLLEYRNELSEQVFEREGRLESIQASLEEKVKEIQGWPLEIKDFNQVRPGIRRTYKRGFKGLYRSEESGKVEDFHEWRKRVKYLRYEIDVMNRLWPQTLEALEDELHEITDFVGMLHDLHNLQATIRKRNSPFADVEEETLFNTLLEKQKDFMKTHALLKGKKFYFDSPTEFCDRLEVYWRTHAQEIHNPGLPSPDHLEYS